ncbi:MAG: HVO_0758 family zinc finger protein [Halanaeroarchaeum sp.]
MESVRKGLRAGALERDTYDRLVCSACDANLDRENDPDEIYDVRECPDCGARFKEL